MDQFLYVLFSLHFLNDGIRTGIIALLPFVSRDLHLSFTMVGFLGSSQGFLGAIMSLPAGFLAGRIGGYKLILLSLLVYSIGALGIGASANLLILIFAFYITAIGFGTFHVVSFSLVARLSQKNNIGRNVGNFAALGDAGRVIIPSAALFAIPYFGWRLTYTGIAILGLAFFGVLTLALQRKGLRNFQNFQNNQETHIEWIKQVALLFKKRTLLLTVLAAVIDGLAGSSIYIFLPFLLLAKGVSVATLGIFIGLYFAGSLSGKSALGRGVDKFGNARIFIAAELLMALSLIFLASLNQIILLLLVAFLLGLFTRGTTPVVTSLFSQVSHSDHYEKVFAISETFLSITAAFSPVAMGIIADQAGISFVFYVASLLAVLACIPILFLNNPK
ncbi:MAG: hypothetical protein A3C27_02795 [Candidatus Levybacteria bacterium RIFCSPHIGHO2_02_FULL_39_36]|nr:MAG: Arabinose efflux permease family protein [Candidatus Levybacteria bacterium GW2011_GWA1_39_11]KKR24689.1 MAG: Arabinose efflux permease family protein [Candidatus Levybacteria bacterium GW2011_GWB1_39_7]OGH27552.1 MAG: hypothetical protein A3C27_02795 [Candidatus Levybacteria bacterium RIFCSPHIGHO2_02_FULL_39_36]